MKSSQCKLPGLQLAPQTLKKRSLGKASDLIDGVAESSSCLYMSFSLSSTFVAPSAYLPHNRWERERTGIQSKSREFRNSSRSRESSESYRTRNNIVSALMNLLRRSSLSNSSNTAFGYHRTKKGRTTGKTLGAARSARHGPSAAPRRDQQRLQCCYVAERTCRRERWLLI